jgi:uncharacterized membrane protein
VRAVLVIHVVLAIFLIGPLVAAANQVARELRSGSAGTVRLLSRTVTIYGWASLLVGIVGFGLVRDRFSFSDGWLIASIVLFVVASVLILALLVPMLRRASAGRERRRPARPPWPRARPPSPASPASATSPSPSS